MRTLVRFAALLLHCTLAFFRSHREQAIVELALVAAVGLVPMGAERLDAFVRWWSERAGGLLRAWAVVAVAFGALLVYAVY